MQRQILVLQQQIEEEKAKSQVLQTEIDAISHDPKTVERLAREKLGYAKPDETVVHFDPPPTNSAGP